MTKTYDINHQIRFKKTSSGNQLELIKNQNEIFSNPAMIVKFLDCYELSRDEFLALADEEAFNAHLTKIETKYGCNHGFIKYKGIIHLEEQKRKSFTPLIRQPPNLKQALIQSSLEWTQQSSSLPILEYTIRLLNTAMYKSNVVSTLDNTLLVLTQQGFSTVEPLIRGLIELGYRASNIVLFTKPHTTSESNQHKFEALKSELGIHYISQPTEEEIFHTPLDEEDNLDETYPSHPNYIYEKTKKTAFNNAINKIKTQLNTTNIKNVIIHDEGGIFTKSSQFKRDCIDPFIQNKIFSMSEHTMSGVESGKQLQVPFPCFLMAHSWLKTKVEAYFIAEKSFLLAQASIENYLREHDEVAISMVGLGNIGSEFANMMIQYAQHNPQKNIKFFVNDMDKAKQETYISNHVRSVDIQYKKIVDMLSQSDFLFGCTGKDIMQGLENQVFDNHSIRLISLSSGNREFKSLLKGSMPGDEPGELIKCISNLEIKIQNEGRPIIFKSGEDDAIHPSKIQVIRAITMATIFQQLNYIAQRNLLKNFNTTDSAHQLTLFDAIKSRFIDIDAYLQQEIWEAFKIFQHALPNHLRNGTELLKLNPEFLEKDGAFQNIMKHNNDFRKNLTINNAKPHAGNYICEYDKNHDLHLIEVDDHLEFAFLKHGQEIVRDPFMDSKILREKGVNLDHYYQMNSIERMIVIKNHYSIFRTETLNLTPAHRTKHQSLTNNL